MNEAMLKLMEKLDAGIKALNETITAKFSSVTPATTDAEKDALVKDVRAMQDQLAKMRQAQAGSKMVFAVAGKSVAEAGEELVTLRGFLKAVKNKDNAYLDRIKAATGMSEGTAADGGYFVPTEFSQEIIPLVFQASIARRICRVFPMGAPVRTFPKGLTKPNIYWLGEGENKTKSKPTIGTLTQTAKKCATIVPVTDELLEDHPAIEQFLKELVAEAFGEEEDRLVFRGNTGAGDPFMGVQYAVGVNDVALEGATPAYADVVALQHGVAAKYRTGGIYVLSGDYIESAMKLVDEGGRPIWTPSMVEGQPSRIAGRPYEESDQLTGTVGLFGDFGKYFYISPRGDYKVDASNSASDGTNHAFIKNETWFRFEERKSLDVARPEAFSRQIG